MQQKEKLLENLRCFLKHARITYATVKNFFTPVFDRCDVWDNLESYLHSLGISQTQRLSVAGGVKITGVSDPNGLCGPLFELYVQYNPTTTWYSTALYFYDNPVNPRKKESVGCQGVYYYSLEAMAKEVLAKNIDPDSLTLDDFDELKKKHRYANPEWRPVLLFSKETIQFSLKDVSGWLYNNITYFWELWDDRKKISRIS